MYKGNSASLQRAHKVHEIASVAPCQDDLILSAGNMDMTECKAERAQLLLEKARCETDLGLAKRDGGIRTLGFIKARYGGINARLALINDRMKELNLASSQEVLRDAVKDVVDAATWKRICDRCVEISAAKTRHKGTAP